MIKSINIKQYRRLKNEVFKFDKNVTAISGTNGTCKTSLLHIISNSFKRVSANDSKFNDKNVMKVLNAINQSVNPKIETLTKGDTTYNDPAPNLKGNLYSVQYSDDKVLDYRRHVSKKENRYAIKLHYGVGRKETLPECPILYLNLGRLYNYGEFNNDDNITKIYYKLPEKYQNKLIENYKELTGIKISNLSPNKMGDIKNRADFISDKAGIDSNTISSGEDNIYIILTALESLRYYFENIQSENKIESILLIDEIDATLHPGLQYELYDLIQYYSYNYKIQVVFTTHSLSLIEYILENNNQLIYLVNQGDSSQQLEDTNIHTIKNLLQHEYGTEIISMKKIPVFMEDDEARDFFDLIIDYMKDEMRLKSIANIAPYLYKVNTKMSAANLKSLFEDKYLIESTMKSICILDGDQNDDLTNMIITLPGSKSLENEIFEYLLDLVENDSKLLKNQNFYKMGYQDNIIKKEITNPISEFKKSQESK
ncbi:AAA family ATPase, partial [Staphylococcus pseudintermedius]|nr:AAA family ATPase [Staphylococcus pseudintermedius]